MADIKNLNNDSVRFEDGSASSPSISFIGDTNTGIYRLSGDSGRFYFTTDGTAAVRIDSNGLALLNKTLYIQSDRKLNFDYGVSNDYYIIKNSTTLNMHSPVNLSLQTNSSHRLYINQSGNVGIGTTSPSRDLHIVKSNDGGQVRFQIINTSNTADSTSVISIYNGGANGGDPFLHWKIDVQQDWSMGIDNSDGDKLKISKNFGPGTNDYLTVDTSGNVGIGTTSPGTKLHILQSGTAVSSDGVSSLVVQKSAAAGTAAAINIVSGDSAEASLRFGDTTDQSMGALRYLNDVDAFSIVTNNNEQVRITSTGNVGIGTTSPTAKFVVNNNGGTGSTFYVDAGNIASTQTLFEHTGSSTPVPFAISKSGYSGNSAAFGILYLDMAHNVAGGGANMHFTLRDSNSNVTEYGGLGATIVTNTDGSEAGRLNFYTTNGGSTRQNRMVISPAGNVGIGTTSPGAKLDVNSGISTSSTDVIKLTQATNGANKAAASLGLSIQNGGETTNAADLWFTTASGGSLSESMRITSAGNVGIGTTSPTETLELVGTAKFQQAGGGVLYLHREDNTVATSNHLGSIRFGGGIDGTNDYNNSAARITAVASNHSGSYQWSSTDTASELQFMTTEAGGTTLSTRMTITHNGNVGIGTTSPGSAFKLDVNGYIKANSRVYVRDSTKTVEIGTDYIQSYVTSGTGVNPIRFFTGSTEKARVDGNGNVGIGTTSPGGKLTVSGSATGLFTNLLLSNTNDTDGDATGIGFSMLNNMTYVKGGIFFERTDTGGRGSIHIATTNTTDSTSVGLSDARLTLDKDGNVGIGTTSPAYRLDVAGTSRSDLHIFRSNQSAPTADAFIFRPADNTVALGTANAERMRITSSGNVGIGTTSPTFTLDVPNGNARFNDIRLNDGRSLSSTSGGTGYVVLSPNNGDVLLNTATNSNNITLQLGAGNPILTVKSNNVGIGNTSPSQKLHVAGNIKATGWIGRDSSNYITFDETNNHIDFYAGGNWVARLESDGDLHVKGDVIAFSDIFNP